MTEATCRDARPAPREPIPLTLVPAMLCQGPALDLIARVANRRLRGPHRGLRRLGLRTLGESPRRAKPQAQDRARCETEDIEEALVDSPRTEAHRSAGRAANEIEFIFFGFLPLALGLQR
jgi:hypothetical protein